MKSSATLTNKASYSIRLAQISDFIYINMNLVADVSVSSRIMKKNTYKNVSFSHYLANGWFLDAAYLKPSYKFMNSRHT